ncbi:Uncharacterised protein [uncultured Clostridium sp.]|nr:Uncharacterised protein [uncultured Clostridium sp.]
MKNQLTIWERGEPFKGKYDIDEVLENNTGLTIVMFDPKSNDIIRLVYDAMVFAYKSIDESIAINTLESFSQRYDLNFLMNNTFFEVRDSGFSLEIENDSCGSVHAKDLFHMKILGRNAFMDIISFGEPKLVIARNNNEFV